MKEWIYGNFCCEINQKFIFDKCKGNSLTTFGDFGDLMFHSSVRKLYLPIKISMANTHPLVFWHERWVQKWIAYHSRCVIIFLHVCSCANRNGLFFIRLSIALFKYIKIPRYSNISGSGAILLCWQSQSKLFRLHPVAMIFGLCLIEL